MCNQTGTVLNQTRPNWILFIWNGLEPIWNRRFSFGFFWIHSGPVSEQSGVKINRRPTCTCIFGLDPFGSVWNWSCVNIALGLGRCKWDQIVRPTKCPARRLKPDQKIRPMAQNVNKKVTVFLCIKKRLFVPQFLYSSRICTKLYMDE